MKVEIKRKEEKKEKPFPKLMEDITNGDIIMFSSDVSGVVVGGQAQDLGTLVYTPNLFKVKYKDFEGELILSND